MENKKENLSQTPNDKNNVQTKEPEPHNHLNCQCHQHQNNNINLFKYILF